MTLEDLIEKYWEWSEKTFDSTPDQAVKGLLREVKELEFEYDKEWDDPEFDIKVLIECADVFFYLIYVLRKQGYTIERWKQVAAKKLETLKTREWVKDETGCFSHVKKEKK